LELGGHPVTSLEFNPLTFWTPNDQGEGRAESGPATTKKDKQ